jgi:hypothetical protein
MTLGILVGSRTSFFYIIKCKHMTLVIDILNNIFPLHTKNAKPSFQVSQWVNPKFRHIYIYTFQIVTYVDRLYNMDNYQT